MCVRSCLFKRKYQFHDNFNEIYTITNKHCANISYTHMNTWENNIRQEITFKTYIHILRIIGVLEN